MPSTGISIPNSFASQPGPIPLSQLDADFATLAGDVNTLLNYSNYFVDSSGAPNSITVTVPSPLVFSYVEGVQLQVKVANTNTLSAVTINVNSLGSKPVINNYNYLPTVGAILAGTILFLHYDGTSFRIINQLGVTLNSNSALDFPITNTNNGTGNAVRVVLTSGDANGALFVSGSGRTSPIVTNGPTGAQMALRTLGNYPIVFGVSNTEALRIEGDGSQFDFSISGNPSFSLNGVSTTGTRTATFSATNKPGSATSGPIAWLPVLTGGGVQGYIPIFGA